ncbi:DAPK2 kinase, partial [Malurus elegans]|nr:DAPK2 kinase [Malurus elegans]
MTAAECLLHPWIKPLSRKQVLSRSRSSINMRNFRKFNARRKWKVNWGLSPPGAASPLGGSVPCPCPAAALCPQRCCESDQEEDRSPPTALLRRRRSSCS